MALEAFVRLAQRLLVIVNAPTSCETVLWSLYAWKSKVHVSSLFLSIVRLGHCHANSFN